MKFKLRDKLEFPLLFAVGCIVILVTPLFLRAALDLATVVILLTFVGGATGFLYAQHFQGLQIFRDLFREFNSRYDILNDRLNEIRDRPIDDPLKREKSANNKSDIDVLYDYFNLCAEEHIYAAAGFIDPSVWIAWQTGMAYFADDPEIRALWEHELLTQQKSYYGFSLDKVRNV